MRLKAFSPNKIFFLLAVPLLLLVILGFHSMKKWETYNSPHLHALNDIWAFGDISIVVGSYRPLKVLIDKKTSLYQKLAQQEAIILYRKNTKKDWVKVYSGRGDILQLSYNTKKKYLYALGREHFTDGRWKAFLLFSKDFGASWEELSALPGKIEGISFASESVSYVWSKDQVYRSIDDAQTWEPCPGQNFYLVISQPTLATGADGIFWYANKSELFSVSPDGQVHKEKLPADLVPTELTTDPNNTLWILTKSKTDGKLYLLKRIATGEFDIVSSLPYFLTEQLYVGYNTSVIVGSDQSDLPPEDVMMQSKDGGKSWFHVPKVPDGTKVFFEGDKVIWRLGTMDRIHRRVN